MSQPSHIYWPSYWIKERRDRWVREQLLGSLTVSVTRITNLSDKNYITQVRSLPVPSRPQDVSTCVSAKKEVEQQIKKAELIKTKLQQQKEVCKAKIVGQGAVCLHSGNVISHYWCQKPIRSCQRRHLPNS